MLFNRCGWAEWVAVDNLTLMALIGIRREHTFIDVRSQLIQNGLIEYEKGKKGVYSRYKLISVESKLAFTRAVQTAVQTAIQTAVQTATQTATINKDKDKDKDKTSSSSTLVTVDKLPNPKSEEEEKIFDLKLIEILEIDCKMYGINSTQSSSLSSTQSSTPNSRHNKTKDKDKDKNIGSIASMNEDTPKVVPSRKKVVSIVPYEKIVLKSYSKKNLKD